MAAAEQVKANAQEYYGKTLKTSQDLKTSSCCTVGAMPPHIIRALENIHSEVQSKYYGCGLTIPHVLEGLRVVDLGCGAGRDCYLLSQLVGPKGFVTGVDMTEEQLKTARDHVDYHTKEFGYSHPNVLFIKSFIEDLSAIPSSSVDLVVSNCVVNLSPDKLAVLREAHRVLREGGEMYFADIYSDRRIPATLMANPVLHGECLSGALYWNDFLCLARQAGFTDPRLVEDRPVAIRNPEMRKLLGAANFFSATYRLFKLQQLEGACEDYGQAVIYRGTIDTCPDEFALDSHHLFPKGKVSPVCRNTFAMLHDTRFALHFQFVGDESTHYGIFPGCGQGIPFKVSHSSTGAASCC